MKKEKMENIRDLLVFGVRQLETQIKEQFQNIEKTFGRDPRKIMPKDFVSSSEEAHLAYRFGYLNGMSYIAFILDAMEALLEKDIKEKKNGK